MKRLASEGRGNVRMARVEGCVLWSLSSSSGILRESLWEGGQGSRQACFSSVCVCRGVCSYVKALRCPLGLHCHSVLVTSALVPQIPAVWSLPPPFTPASRHEALPQLICISFITHRF